MFYITKNPQGYVGIAHSENEPNYIRDFQSPTGYRPSFGKTISVIWIDPQYSKAEKNCWVDNQTSVVYWNKLDSEGAILLGQTIDTGLKPIPVSAQEGKNILTHLHTWYVKQMSTGHNWPDWNFAHVSANGFLSEQDAEKYCRDMEDADMKGVPPGEGWGHPYMYRAFKNK